jgi:maltose alpha-D-glucosyltransferase/alpha-amylase
MMQYGDEIGIGDDLRLPERECARTPMQWTSDRHAGFSTARRTVRPVIDDAVYGYERVNVADLRRDPASLLNWTERVIRMRKECPEISWGDFEIVRTSAPEVLALCYEWRDTSLLTLHNFAKSTRHAGFKLDRPRGELLEDLFDGRHSRRRNDGQHRVTLEPYGWRWFRVGAADNTLHQSELVMTDSSVR